MKPVKYSPVTKNEAQVFESLHKVLNGNVSLVSGAVSPTDGASFPLGNLDCRAYYVNYNVAINTDKTLTHSLGRVPVGYIILGKDSSADIYNGSTAATSTQIKFRATVSPFNFTVLIF